MRTKSRETIYGRIRSGRRQSERLEARKEADRSAVEA
jgi:hypothetical protein